MPPQVDLRSAAGLLTWRPEASLPELEAVLTDLIPHRDETAYSRAAISLAIRAMHVYEDVLAERLQDLFQVSYCDDHTGWMGMRRCADLLQIMTRRRTAGVAPAPPPPPHASLSPLWVSPHLYADDTQIYGSCSPSYVDMFLLVVTDCVNAVADWMRSNRLQLNSDKTESCGVQRSVASTVSHRWSVNRILYCDAIFSGS